MKNRIKKEISALAETHPVGPTRACAHAHRVASLLSLASGPGLPELSPSPRDAVLELRNQQPSCVGFIIKLPTQ
jgi:hypothetical protein